MWKRTECKVEHKLGTRNRIRVEIDFKICHVICPLSFILQTGTHAFIAAASCPNCCIVVATKNTHIFLLSPPRRLFYPIVSNFTLKLLIGSS